ncbi:MAG: polysaccharide biosynthesis protein [Sphingobacteriaceae bacterium]|jgi:O-antigen/teichoic acid export membrane protein|nr:polysaccharide biosynthesis protein [Sphingobacteriaceae bacterium]
MEKAKDNYWLKSGIINILQNFSGTFFNLAGFYILVRVLSKHEYGAWILFMGITGIMETIRGGLVQNALVRFLPAASDEDKPRIITSSFIISLSLSGICMLLIYLFGHLLTESWRTPELLPIIFLYPIVFITTGFINNFVSIEQANFRFQGVFVISVVRQGVFFLYLFICFVIGIEVSLIHLMYVFILSALLSLLTSWIYVKRDFVFSRKIFPEWIKKLFNYGKYGFGTSVSSILSGTIDQWMLGSMLSPASAAEFNIAVRITNLIDVPTSAVAAIVFPQSAKRIETEGRDAVKYLYEKSVGTILALLIPGVIFLYFFAGFVIGILAPKYESSIPLLHITLLYCLLIPYGRQFGTILDSIGKTKTTFYIVLVTASLNLGLNYFFIKEWGVMGAAYATLCSNVVGFAIAQIILRRELNVNIGNTLVYAWKFYPEFYTKYLVPLRQKSS